MKFTINAFSNAPPLLKEKTTGAILKWSLMIGAIILFSLCFNSAFAQSDLPVENPTTSKFTLGVKGGYDLPLFNMPFEELNYKGNRYLGAHLDFRLPSNFGLRADYANILTNPNIKIPDRIYYGMTPSLIDKKTRKVNRNFVGLGPSYYLNFGNSRAGLLIAPMAGVSWISGGDARAENMAISDLQLVNTGFKDRTFAAKGDLDFVFAVSDNFNLTLGFYYLRHFGVNHDLVEDISGTTSLIAHGENVYDHTTNPYTMSADPPNVVMQDPNKPLCSDLASMGINLGLSYTFGKKIRKYKKPDRVVERWGPPMNLIVMVRDQQSQQLISDTDVAVKDVFGNIVTTGVTNSFGLVKFQGLEPADYTIVGNVFGVETTIESVMKEEFDTQKDIRKEVLYTDMRFILKGTTTNRTLGRLEPAVLVMLTNDQSKNVKQDNSDGNGEFTFRLDQNSSYEVVGNKNKRLSDIEKTSTIGLTRSTTLFVDLELGMDEFDCGQGAVLDVKYRLDKSDLTSTARFELDKLVRYMNDHPASRVELSSHTDCRGSDRYNKKLSQRRAESAVSYIVSKGISQSRIIAKGYGETRLLNNCADGVNCSESEHEVNRRTEAKLLCN